MLILIQCLPKHALGIQHLGEMFLQYILAFEVVFRLRRDCRQAPLHLAEVAVLVLFREHAEVAIKAFATSLAGEFHLNGAFERVVGKLLVVALGTFYPLSATRSAHVHLRVDDVLAHGSPVICINRGC